MRTTPLPVTLLRVGHRCGAGAEGSGLVHRVAMVLAGTTAMLTMWLIISIVTVYDQRDLRMAARAPLAATAESEILGWRWAASDTASDRQFPVVTLVPRSAGAPPPPGLARWPEPGEAFLSPALIAADHDGALKQRYGRFAGQITADGLADANELLVYRRPALAGSSNLEPADGAATAGAVAGFGDTLPDHSLSFNDRDRGEVLQLVVAVVLLPACALMLVAVRTGAERRDARLAMLDALGAPTSARAWVLLGEAAVPVTSGVALGTAIALATTWMDLTLPFTGYRVSSSDLAAGRPALAVAAVAAVAVLLAVVVVAQIRRRSPLGTRPMLLTPPVRRWPATVFLLAMASAVCGAVLRGNPGRIFFVLGMLAALATLPAVAGLLATSLGRAVARRGNRRGSVSAIVGGRWLSVRPGVLARVSAVFVIGLGLATQAQVMQTQLTSVGTQAGHLQQRVGDRVIEIRRSGSAPDGFAAFAGSLDSGRSVHLYQRSIPGSPRPQQILVGSMQALTILGKPARLGEQALPATDALEAPGRGWEMLDAAGMLAGDGDTRTDPATVLLATHAPEDAKPYGVAYFNAAGRAGVDTIKKAAYTTMTFPLVTVAADDFAAAADAYADLVNWLLCFALLGMTALIVTGALAVTAVFVAQTRELGPLSTFGTGRRLYIGIAAWNLGLPLAATAVAGAVTAAVLAYLLISLAPNGRVSLAFLGACLSAAIAAAATVAVSGGIAASRSARSWRPSSD